jgi:hypothetical protein
MESAEHGGAAIGPAPDHHIGTERGLRARCERGQGGGLLHPAVFRKRSGPRRGRRLGSGGRSAHRGSDAPEPGTAPGGGRLRPGGPRTVRPDPKMHARGWPAATRRPPPRRARPGGQRRLHRRPGCQLGDADCRRRGLAHGPAPCRPGCRSQASRRAPSRDRREPPSRTQTDRSPSARRRCNPYGFPGRSHRDSASPSGAPDTPPNTPAQARRAPRETAAKSSKIVSRRPRAVAQKTDFCHLMTASLDDKLMTNDLEARSECSDPASDLLLRVGGTRFELVTSSVSGKRSPAELTAREAEAGIEPAYRALQALA